MTDEMRTLIVEANHPALLFWRGQGLYLLFVLELSDADCAAFNEIANAGGMSFGGVFAMVDGKPVVKVASVEAIGPMGIATGMYATRIAEKVLNALEKTPRTNDAEWLTFMSKLTALKDERSEFGPA